MTLLLLALSPAALAVDGVKVLSDSTPQVPPGVVHFAIKDGVPRKLGLVKATDVSGSGSMVVVEKLYEDVCTAPCTLEMPVGWHEFHLELGKHEWIHKSEGRPGEQTYTLIRQPRPVRFVAGLTLTSLIVTAPVGVPLLVTSMPKAKRSEGPPVH